MARRSPKGLAREVDSVRLALREFERSLAKLSRALRAPGAVSGPQLSEKARQVTLSPSRLKALKLHGRYLGYIRQLKTKQRAEVKATRKKKGVEVAIKRARKLARGD